MGSTISPDRVMREQCTTTPSPGPSQPPQGLTSSHQPKDIQSNKSTGRGRPPKERLSCDACAAAKVKCSKERPRCERCIESDLTCVYGLSMKYGKGSKKKRQQQNAQYQARSQHNGQSASNDDFWQQSYANLLNSFSNASSTLPTNLPWATPSQSLLSDPTSFATGSQGPLFPPPMDSNDATWMDGVLPMGNNHDMSHINSSLLDSGISSNSESYDKMFDLLTTDDQGMMDIENHSMPRKSTSMASLTEPHDLYSLANSTLGNLSLDQKPATGPNGSVSPKSSDETSPNLEDILRATKDAMANLEHLLVCSSATDSHILIMCASIMMRILFWHQVAAGNGRPSESLLRLPKVDSPPFKSRSDSVLGHQTPSSSSQQMSIDAAPVHIGGHIIDEEDQGPIRLMFLLSNLKKLGRLIETFRNLGSQINGEHPSTQLHAHICNCLQWELNHVMNEVGAAANSSTAAWVASQQA